jgi:hypothetical protein
LCSIYPSENAIWNPDIPIDKADWASDSKEASRTLN